MEMIGLNTEKSRPSQNTCSSSTLSQRSFLACHQALRDADVVYTHHNISGELDLYDRAASLQLKLALNTKNENTRSGDDGVTLHDSWNGVGYV